MTLAASDISVRKQLELELCQANEHLHEFSAVASNDLDWLGCWLTALEPLQADALPERIAKLRRYSEGATPDTLRKAARKVSTEVNPL